MNQDSRLSERVAARQRPTPPSERMTHGNFTWPPHWYRLEPMLWTNWFEAIVLKSMYMSSGMGAGRGAELAAHLIFGSPDVGEDRPLGLDLRSQLRRIGIDIDVIFQLGDVRRRALLREADRLLDRGLRPVSRRLHFRLREDL